MKLECQESKKSKRQSHSKLGEAPTSSMHTMQRTLMKICSIKHRGSTICRK